MGFSESLSTGAGRLCPGVLWGKVYQLWNCVCRGYNDRIEPSSHWASGALGKWQRVIEEKIETLGAVVDY